MALIRTWRPVRAKSSHGSKQQNTLYTYFVYAFGQNTWSLRLENISICAFKTRAPQNPSVQFSSFLAPEHGSFFLERDLFMEPTLRKFIKYTKTQRFLVRILNFCGALDWDSKNELKSTSSRKTSYFTL